MLENRMVIDSEWPEEEERESAWEEYRDLHLMQEFAFDEDIIAEAVEWWLDSVGADQDRLIMVYDYMPDRYKEIILQGYIEFESLEGRFDEWYDDRKRGSLEDV